MTGIDLESIIRSAQNQLMQAEEQHIQYYIEYRGLTLEEFVRGHVIERSDVLVETNDRFFDRDVVLRYSQEVRIRPKTLEEREEDERRRNAEETQSTVRPELGGEGREDAGQASSSSVSEMSSFWQAVGNNKFNKNLLKENNED